MNMSLNNNNQKSEMQLRKYKQVTEYEPESPSITMAFEFEKLCQHFANKEHRLVAQLSSCKKIKQQISIVSSLYRPGSVFFYLRKVKGFWDSPFEPVWAQTRARTSLRKQWSCNLSKPRIFLSPLSLARSSHQTQPKFRPTAGVLLTPRIFSGSGGLRARA